MSSRRSTKWRHKGSRNYEEEEERSVPLSYKRHRRTKIVATVGPACSSLEMIEKLMLAGVNIFRLNFSHGTHEDHARVHAHIRSLSTKLSRHVGILADLQGPKFRVGKVEGGSLELKQDQLIHFTTSRNLEYGNEKCLATGTPHADTCIEYLKPGQRLMINDGLVVLEVEKRINRELILCRVMVPGTVSDRKGINVPDLQVPMPALTEKDTMDAIFALSLGVDFIALSFVQRKKDVVELRDILRKHARDDQWLPMIISKIEKPQALDVIDDIMAVSDGIMVARGDLGVECSLEKVPRYQKMLIEKCALAMKPVITATQMLESMTSNPFPTRSEVSDVANAVYDGSDAVMLSGESAAGLYPVEAVKMMSSICCEAERTFRWYKAVAPTQTTLNDFSLGEAVAHTAVNAVNAVTKTQAVIAVVVSIDFAQVLSKLRPRTPVICVCFTPKMAGILELYYGLLPLLIEDPFSDDSDDSSLISSDEFIALIEAEVARCAEFPWLNHGDIIVLASGESRLPSLVNSINFHEFGTAQRNLSARRWQRIATGQRMTLQRRVSQGLERRRSSLDAESIRLALADHSNAGSQSASPGPSVPGSPNSHTQGHGTFSPERVSAGRSSSSASSASALEPASLAALGAEDPELAALLLADSKSRRPAGAAALAAASESDAAEQETEE